MTLDKINVCIIDDEKGSREALKSVVESSLEMEFVGEAESVDEAVALILTLQPDAVFLDIKLREGDAFQVLNILRRKMDRLPAVILNTGYSDFELAQKAFNKFKEEVILILKKPFWEDWEKKEQNILNEIHNYYREETDFSSESGMLKIKSKRNVVWVYRDDLLYLEVDDELKGNGKVKLQTKDYEYVITKSLNQLEDLLPDCFVRISRYCIVNIRHIRFYDSTDQVLFLNGIKDRNFGVGNAYKKYFADMTME